VSFESEQQPRLPASRGTGSSGERRGDGQGERAACTGCQPAGSQTGLLVLGLL